MPDVKPLSARSMVLSLILGAHPTPMPAAALTRAAGHFDIAPSTLRASLTRAVAAGDLTRGEDGYGLGKRLLARQARQDEAVAALSADWSGDWELAVVVVAGRSAAARGLTRERLQRDRLAELREGVWMRPANLRRSPGYTADPALATMRCRPDQDARGLAESLWDLREWAEAGHRLVADLGRSVKPAQRLALAAHLVRHLATDPILPAALLPASWPGVHLRTAYADYQAELRSLVS
jgi:phenylacetic acid degradation operon negative regulatory protein